MSQRLPADKRRRRRHIAPDRSEMVPAYRQEKVAEPEAIPPQNVFVPMSGAKSKPPRWLDRGGL
jgi:hypothetical protein